MVNWQNIADKQGAEVPVEQLKENIIRALQTIYDPEIPVNIYDLGLIYDLDVDAQGKVDVRMTLTAPGCPVAQTFPGTVEQQLYSVPGVTEARVELVWDPPWDRDRMSEAAKLQLGML
ncbi:MAG: SUF system Fe-S cluster assembly protein [Burkholderiales bacterium]